MPTVIIASGPTSSWSPGPEIFRTVMAAPPLIARNHARFRLNEKCRETVTFGSNPTASTAWLNKKAVRKEAEMSIQPLVSARLKSLICPPICVSLLIRPPKDKAPTFKLSSKPSPSPSRLDTEPAHASSPPFSEAPSSTSSAANRRAESKSDQTNRGRL